MIEKINLFQVAILQPDVICEELTPENAELYYTATQYSEPILKRVVSEFELALKEESGLEQMILKSKKEWEIRKGSIDLKVTAKPSFNTKYMEVGREIDQYLTDLERNNELRLRRDGIIRIDDVAYICIDEVVEKTDELISQFTKQYTSFSFSYTKMKSDPSKNLRLVGIEPGTYGDLTGNNANVYRLAKEQLKLLQGRVIKPFKSLLKTKTGFNLNNLPTKPTLNALGIGRFIFTVDSIPKADIKYGEAAKGFIKYTHECQENHENVRVRDDRDLIAIPNLVTEYRRLVAEQTSPGMEQRINLLPNPKYDQVLVNFG
jgi:hypothetical protein